MAPDPFRRPPMVDIPIAKGESIFWRLSRAMDRLAERVEAYEPAEPYFLGQVREWLDEAGTCPRCGCHPDRRCGCTPDACGCTPPPGPTDRQVCESAKTTPPTGGTTTGSPGGTGMPNIEEARSTIMGGHQSAEQALNELMSAHRSLEDSQNALMRGTEGSNQAEAEQAHAQLTEALSKIDEARQQVASALQEFEGVGQRL